jgi:hypothetical protein
MAQRQTRDAENKHNSWSRMHSQPRKREENMIPEAGTRARVGLYLYKFKSEALFLGGGELIEVW